MTILYITVGLYMILLLANKRLGIIKYSILATFIYLVSLSFTETLDITLPLYIVFIIAPNLGHFALKSKTEFLILCYFSCVMIFSIVGNDLAEAFSVFIVRLAGIVLFFYIYKEIPLQTIQSEARKEKDVLTIVALLVGSEILLFALAYYLSDGDLSSRLMLNYQCTVGCVSTGGMLLMAYFLKISKHKKTIWVAMVLMLGVVLFTATRGYIVVAGGVFMAAALCFISNRRKAVYSVGAAFALILFFQHIYELIFSSMRFGESTGRRHAENLFLIKSLGTSHLYNVLFGHGFGTSLTTVPEFESILSEVSNSNYTYYILHHVSGFHNFWATICYAAGIMGLLFIGILYFSLFWKARRYCKDKKIRLCIYAFLAAYFILLWYRWSATSGVFEFFVLAVVMKLSSQETIGHNLDEQKYQIERNNPR